MQLHISTISRKQTFFIFHCVSCRCLMRLVDDFLLISPDLHEAQNFLKYEIHQLCQYSLCDTKGLLFIQDLFLLGKN